jgi:hypothetical protein
MALTLADCLLRPVPLLAVHAVDANGRMQAQRIYSCYTVPKDMCEEVS